MSYIEDLLSKKEDSPVIKKAQQYAKEHFVPIMRKECSAVLGQIVRLKQPGEILEVGTAIGYSGIIMLTACPTAKLYTIEYNETRVREAKQNFAQCGVADRATVFTGDVKEILPFVSGHFDMVFLDGPKGHYGEFLQTLMPHLNPGAVIVCDNVLFRGYVENPTLAPRRMKTITCNMEKFLETLVTSPDFETSILDIGDGVSVSIYKGNENDHT